jgi:hypothetical protein
MYGPLVIGMKRPKVLGSRLWYRRAPGPGPVTQP